MSKIRNHIFFICAILISGLFVVSTAGAQEQVVEGLDLPVRTDFLFGDDGKGNPAGELSWAKGHLEFKGDADKSALLFFEYLLKPLVDKYILVNCQKEVKKDEIIPKTKCDEMGIKHAWVDTTDSICAQQGNELICPPTSKICLNCGLKSILRIEQNEHWEYKLPN